MWRAEKTDTGTDLVWDGMEQGIAPAPTKGTANLQNVNIATETGEALVSYARLRQLTQEPIVDGTLTASVGLGTELLEPSSPIVAGQWINITASTIPRTSIPVEYVVVGGGGGGGSGGSGGTAADKGGGGGGGGVLTGDLTLTVGVYAVTIGAGGAGATAPSTDGDDGTGSSFAALVVTDGGGGGGGAQGPARPGASGGGAGGNSDTHAAGIGGQGNIGGAGLGNSSGGGGGAGQEGQDANGSPSNGGDGGDGKSTFAGTFGGGGGGAGLVGGTGGTGGGGNGHTGNSTGPGDNATANTGGGGGGGGEDGSDGGAGGSGKVVIRYPTGSLTATGGTITTSGGNTIHTFNSSGDFEITAIADVPTGLYFVSFVNTDGEIKISSIYDPLAEFVLVHGTSGTATFSTVHPTMTTAGIAKAKEKYQTATSTEWRYYILDADGYVWVWDTGAYDSSLANSGVATEWMLPDPTDYSANDFTGMAILNGWLLVLNNTTIYGKTTSTLGEAFEELPNAVLNNPFPTHTNFAYVGHQGKMFYCDGNYIGELFPNTSLITAAANVQSYAQYDAEPIDITFTSSLSATADAATLTVAWPNPTGTYLVRFGNGEVRPVEFTEDSTFVQWDDGLLAASDDTAVVLSMGEVTILISGSMPYTVGSSGAVRIPAVFFPGEDGELPDALNADEVYYIERTLPGNTFAVYDAITGGDPLDITTGAEGPQFFNTFYVLGDEAGIDGSVSTLQYSSQRLNLPQFEIAQCMVEIGNSVLIGGITNAIYPWNQIDATPSDIIELPEADVKTMINVNNMAYVFAGSKGNIYISNNSVASLVYKVPDYCAGVPGTPLSYIEPYFTWGDAMYLRGRVYFSILDQTAIKAGNCGGVWSFAPTQNFYVGQDTGIALRLENQNSYGNYSGMATLLLAPEEQKQIAPQYWATWQDGYTIGTSTDFGIDFTDDVPATTAVIETDLIPTGTFLDKQTFQQLEYKLTTPLSSGDGVQLYYRLNSTDAWTSAGTVREETDNRISGYYDVNFQKTQWVQFRGILTSNGTPTSSFVRFKEIRLR